MPLFCVFSKHRVKDLLLPSVEERTNLFVDQRAIGSNLRLAIRIRNFRVFGQDLQPLEVNVHDFSNLVFHINGQ